MTSKSMGKIKMITDKKLKQAMIVQPNSLVSASYQMSLNAKRIVVSFLSQLESEEKTDMYLSLTNFNKTFGTNLNTRELRAAAKELDGKKIKLASEYTDPSGSSWCKGDAITLVDAAVYRDGEIHVGFNMRLMPILVGMTENFTKYMLRDSVQLKSVYAVRLYELFKQYQKIGSRTMTIEELREMFNLQNKYKVTADFRKRVIDKPLQEINENTTLNVSLELVKYGRKTTGFKFSFRDTAAEKYEKVGQKIEKALRSNKKVCIGGFSFSAFAGHKPNLKVVGQYGERNFKRLLEENNFEWEIVR